MSFFLAMKRMVNLAEATLPPPPSVADFVAALERVNNATSDNVDALLGQLPVPDVKVKDLRKTYKAALRAFFDYKSCCDAWNVEHATLDDFFKGWAL